MSNELERERREVHAVLQQPGVRPDDSVQITRRTFVHRSLLFGAATVGQTFAWWPLLNTIDIAHAAPSAVPPSAVARPARARCRCVFTVLAGRPIISATSSTARSSR